MTNKIAAIEENPIAPAASIAVTPMDLLQKAMDSNADLDKLEKLMDMQERWETSEARKAFVKALNNFKANPPEILKDKKIAHSGKHIADYAGLDQVSRVIGAALSERGISHRWNTDQAEGQIKVTCILTHDLGHSEITALQAGADTSGAKNNIQAIGSTVTYLQRYTLLAATGMSVGDVDDDGNGSGAKIDDAQKAELVGLIKQTDTDTKRLVGVFGAESLDALPSMQFVPAREMLRAKLRKIENAKTEGDAE